MTGRLRCLPLKAAPELRVRRTKRRNPEAKNLRAAPDQDLPRSNACKCNTLDTASLIVDGRGLPVRSSQAKAPRCAGRERPTTIARSQRKPNLSGIVAIEQRAQTRRP